MFKVVATFLALTTLWAGGACAADYTYTPTARDRADMQNCLDLQGADKVPTCASQIVTQIFSGGMEAAVDVLNSRSTEHTRKSPQLTDMIRRSIVFCGADKMTQGATYPARVIDALDKCMSAEGGKIGYAISSALVRDARR
jgi:hypothetical protein